MVCWFIKEILTYIISVECCLKGMISWIGKIG